MINTFLSDSVLYWGRIKYKTTATLTDYITEGHYCETASEMDSKKWNEYVLARITTN